MGESCCFLRDAHSLLSSRSRESAGAGHSSVCSAEGGGGGEAAEEEEEEEGEDLSFLAPSS